MEEQLIQAAREGNLEVVKHRLQENTAYKDVALYEAATEGHLEIVKYLFEQGADIHARYDSALRLAASKGHTETVKYLVEQGAEINSLEALALREAVSGGHIEVIEFLLDNGADIDARDTFGLALRYGGVKTVKLLITRGAKITDEIVNGIKNEEILEHIKITQRRGIKGAKVER